MGTTPTSGFTQSYTDPSSGVTLANAWIQLTNILYVPSNYCLVVVNIYKDQSSYQEGMAPVFPSVRYQSNFNDSNWNTFFDASVMDQANKNIQAQSILYLQGIIELNHRN